MNNNHKKIPQLRFPKFTSEWVEKRLGEIAERGKEKYNPDKDNVDYKCIELESIEQNTGKLISTFKAKELKSIKNKFHIGEVLFGKLRPYLRKFYFAEFDGVCSSEIWVLKGINVTNRYLYYLIQTENFNYQVNLTTGSKMPRADWNAIYNSKFIIPTSFREQTKIATFLTAVDKRINLLQKKKEKLEAYKKGMMQKLFSQQIRFKQDDGNDFPDWEEKWLGEVAEKKSSNISANSLPANKGDYKIYGATGYLQNIDFYQVKVPYISIVKDGAGVGRTLLCEEKSSVLGTLDIIKPKGNNNLYFVYLIINRIRFEKYITGSTIPHIYFKDYSKEKVKIPCNEEQQKIAGFLSSIDKFIETVEKQIEQSRQWKKGLLQKMFV